ncbi:Vesicle-mediated ER to Golgi transport protein [Kickxella alabastrina]|uniref:Vesicle-mediated ER to Golgi transport protein n=1 Tax=Kickxella alabastrina TaxID=61397 RepID=A0ACC1IHK4_9FUNG|nr:Vesicle-mediated ER to Golgi transport protein [Kickxella alabastrina]
MDFFKRYGAIGAQQQQSPSETIQRMADTVETSTLLEDRRAAVLGLKGLTRDYREEVGDAALPALLKALKEDSEDQNMLKAILEMLTNFSTRNSPKGDALDVGNGSSDPVADKFSQVILDDKDDVISTFLELLGDSYYYVRYYTVQLLGALHKYSGEELQKRVLISPMGVGRLVDLLSDQHEFVRIEGIQLLIAMTESNADIQKIVAFENAFDYLLNIVNDEGGARGNIVVQDCLQLLHNLLNYNISNQNFFREASGIQKLPNLLITDPSQAAAGRGGQATVDSDEELEWTAQHARNMLVVLDIIRMLIQPGNTNTESNQTAMQQCGIIPPLLQLALAYEAPSSVRSQALYAIGDIIRSHHANQNLFQRILITAAIDDDPEPTGEKSIPEPAIVIVIRLSVGRRPTVVPANEYYIVRAAAAYLVQAYVGNNADAQLALAATLTPPNEPSSAHESELHQSAGSMIVSVLLNWSESSKEDLWRVWYASLLLSTILRGHNECKEQALKISLGDESKGEEPLPLINELMSQARQATQQGADARVSISLLTLICVWLVNFPRGVSAFLDESSNLSFLVEQINGSSGVNTLVQGVAAFLFGLVYQFDLDAESPMARDAIYPILSKRVGTDQLQIRVQRLRDSKEFQYAVGLAAGTHSNVYGGVPMEVYFDNVFTDLFKAHYESFRAAVRLGPYDAMANPSYGHLQGGMVGYAGSATPGSAPGTPHMTGAAFSSSVVSPTMLPAVLPSGSQGSGSTEPMVPKSELEAVNTKLADQASELAKLQQALEDATREARSAAASKVLEEGQRAGAQVEEERQLRANAEAERDTHADELSQLRAQLSEVQNQLAETQGQQQGTADSGAESARIAELEQHINSLKLDGEKQHIDWQARRDEMQKKLTNAEKQVVKAAAAVRNTTKKKEQHQASVVESLKKQVQEKDEQIAKLTAQAEEFAQKAKQLEQMDELKERMAGLEKEQEDLLVYLADQDLQAKEFRAKLRKYGEDIPLSDEEGDDDDNDDEDDEDDN